MQNDRAVCRGPSFIALSSIATSAPLLTIEHTKTAADKIRGGTYLKRRGAQKLNVVDKRYVRGAPSEIALLTVR